ncbi:MAG: T9SS type A sorting domain-containing protein [Hymenobacteraceae bacterium]|nr:T9SS type A sorting domain-containing protein [Hymenobacteraceae bacterium]
MWTPLPATVPNRSPHSLTPTTGWKSLLAALALGGMSVLPAQAQLNYPASGFHKSVDAGGYTTIKGGMGTANITIGAGNADNGRTLPGAPAETIGFSFPYNGLTFTNFVLYTNGFVRLGSAGLGFGIIAALPGYNGQSVVNDDVGIRPPLSYQGGVESNFTGVLSPFNHDLVPGVQPVGTGAHFMKQVSGAPGSQVLTIEWWDMADKSEASGSGQPSTPTQFTAFSFQLKLYETTGRIEFVYDSWTPTVNVASYQTASIGIRGINNFPGNAYTVEKLETAPWTSSVEVAARIGGVGRNFELPDGFEWNKSTAPEAGRTFQFDPNIANTDNSSVQIYSQGQIALGVGYAARARLANETTTTTLTADKVVLTVTGPAGFVTFRDTQTVAPGVVPYTSPNASTGGANVTFAPFTPTVLGLYTQTVKIITLDQRSSDDQSSYVSTATTNILSYASSAPAEGAVGFNTTTGIIIAKFTIDAKDSLASVLADFDGTNPGAAYRAVIYANNAGVPGALLAASANQVTTATPGTVNIPLTKNGINVPITQLIVNAANLPTFSFFAGIEQLATNNVGVNFEDEAPLRLQTFFVKFGAGAFQDAAPAGNPFRFAVGVEFKRAATATPLCVTTLSPPNGNPDQPLSGTIQFSPNNGVGGANTAADYIIYFGTNQTAVNNELPGAQVATITSNTFDYTSLGLTTSTTYYYKVVARNFLGKATGCATRSFVTVPPPPANDNCANAQTLTIKGNGLCGAGTSGTTLAATEAVGSTDPSCTSGTINDVWYKFTSGLTNYVVSINLTRLTAGLGGASQLGLEITKTSCGGTVVGQACNLNAVSTGITFTMDPGATYYLRVFTNTSFQTPGKFTICLSQRPNLIVNSSQLVPANSFNNVIVNAGTATLTGPLQANNVIVRNGATLLTGTSILSGGKLTVEAGGTIGVSGAIAAAPAATGSLQFAQMSLSNDASYIYSNQSNSATGAGLPSIVRNLSTSANPSGDLALTNALSVRQVLTINNGSLDISTANLTLLSNVNSTAMVVNAGTGTTTGSALVQRYVSRTLNPGDGYRHLASPVAGSSISDLAAPNFTPFVNPAYNTPATRATLTLANFPNIFFFSEPAAAAVNDFVEGYRSPTDLSLTMTAMRGFSVYTRPTTFTFNGALNNNGFSRAITNTGSTPNGAGFNMVGNPYPSPIDWDKVTIPGGMSSAVFVFRSTGPNQAGNYVTYTNGVGPLGVELIPMAQAFFVQTSASTSFALSNSDRVTTYQNPALFRRVETRPLVELALAQAGQSADVADRTYVYFQDGATANGNDLRFDASKLPSTGTTPTLATRANGQTVGINGLPVLTGADVSMPVVANVTVTGTYVLNAEKVINFSAGTQVLLEDALTGTMQDLSQNPTYTFTATAYNNAPRFTLHFRGSGVTGVSTDITLSNMLAVYPNPVSGQPLRVELAGLNTERSVSVRLVNTLGQVVTQQVVQVANAAIATELNVDKLARGIYTLQVQAGGRTASRQVVVQ